MDMQKTGKLILDRRKELGFTQQELGEKLHVTTSAVSKWERGLSFPDITLLEDMASVLGVTVEEIIDGKMSLDNQQEMDSPQSYKVLDVAKTQATINKNKTKKIVTTLLIVLAVIVIAFVGVVSYFATVDYDSTSWRDEFEVTAYNGSKLTISLRAKVGAGLAYYGDSKIVTKKNKIGNCFDVAKYLRDEMYEDIEILDTNFSSAYQIERTLQDGTKEYFAMFYDVEKQWIYFVSQEVRLINGDEYVDLENYEYIFFPLVVVNDVMLHGIDLGLEYRLPAYYKNAYEQDPIDGIIGEFEEFYSNLANYSYARNGADITITDEIQDITITVHFYEVYGHLLYKVTK